MKDGYTWSGGPWFAKWNKGESIVLTPNPNYWGTEAAPRQGRRSSSSADTSAEFQAFKSDQVDAIYPQPQLDVVDAIKAGLPDANTAVQRRRPVRSRRCGSTTRRPPFDSKAFRQAIGYAIDRDAIVNQLFGELGVTKAVNSLNPCVVADYSDPDAWSNYKLNLDKVDELMTGDGWAKGTDGIWAKDGKKAAFTIVTTAGNKRVS